MVESVESLINRIETEKTVLLFGSGSSVPSRAPTSKSLISFFSSQFGIPETGFTLPEISSLAEQKVGRRMLISALREKFKGLNPTGGLLNLPLYTWKSIYTTNYDDLIEKSYKRRNLPFNVFASEFDFKGYENPLDQSIFKIHGTIEKDAVDGNQSRIILTDGDYDLTTQYRETLYNRLKADLSGAMLIICGHSLADPDIRTLVNNAASLNTQMDNGGQIILFVFEQDIDRAALFERRGIRVCFGGIDDFFAELIKKKLGRELPAIGDDPLDKHPALRPATIDVLDVSDQRRADPQGMFNGRPATHADILAGLTFERSVCTEIVQQITNDQQISVTLLGASGVGKTTAARQVLQKLCKQNVRCWEHKSEMPLLAKKWIDLAEELRVQNISGVLLIDDAHEYIFEINEIADSLLASNNSHLTLLLIATRHQWNPRIKSATLSLRGKEFRMSQLSSDEITRLLELVDINPSIKKLIEPNFNGFSKIDKRRRLVDKCEADMFVCLRSIFSSEKFDDIILREYTALSTELQDIYRYLAAMENSGVKVHRQLLIRILNIPASTISAALDGLTDIIKEDSLNEKEGIFIWKTRHNVIASIITKYKFNDIEKMTILFERVIQNLQPTYDIEIRTIKELCNVGTGIPSIPDREVQNKLFRMMISRAQGVRVPRHRLIRNLLSSGDYESAETEIRVFESDLGLDGPAYRYKIDLAVARAIKTVGLMNDDRKTILEDARKLALSGITKFPFNRLILTAYGDVGIEYYRLSGNYEMYDDAIEKLREAEEKLADIEFSRAISRLEKRIKGQPVEADNEQL